MQGFAPLDYIVFTVYVAASVLIGVYFVKEQRTVKDYFLAGQTMNWFVVAISVIAALFSGISYLAAPTEVFKNDMTYAVTLLAFFVATPVTTVVFLPFFYRLKLYTAYEYFEKRFDGRLRYLASALFIIRVVFWLAAAIYAPALAVAEVTRMPLWFSVVVIGLLTTIYTTLGGMKAVIWTDVMQFFVLVGGQVLVAWIAISRVPGGWSETLRIADEGGKFNFLNLDWDLTVRVTFWSALIGGVFSNLVQMATDQVSVQRYLTAKSLREAQRSLWFKLAVTVPVVIVFYLMGAVLYAFYQAHPEALAAFGDKKPDRILPYFVINELPVGIPGVLIAAIFAATMSTVSSGINALSTATIMDFYRRNLKVEPEAERLLSLSKWLTLVYGLLATAAGFVVPLLGTLIEATNKIMGIFGGPLLGVFLLGLLTRRATSRGALLGGLVGSAALAYVVFATKVSFMWYAAFGTIATFALGYVFSLLEPAPARDKTDGLVWSPETMHHTLEDKAEVSAAD